MSRPVDERIISLKMDNKNFESNARESLGTFAKMTNMFKKSDSLDLTKSSKSLTGLKAQADALDMNLLQEALETVKYRFSTLGVIATNVLNSIVSKVTEVANSLIRGLAVTPVLDGLTEYELKMKSIQTIMSNTEGKHTVAEVGVVLDELNTYADKTIYNFSEMTRNVGLFTTAGVGLEDSAIAIQGIGNLSAAVGADAQNNARAMYQLSQALATGTVKLMDWRSVENAGMGGKLFQNALIKNAELLDINVDKSVAFRDSLSKGWLTNEVLLATFKEFATDPSMLEAATKVRTFTQLMETTAEALGSGWATTFEHIVGDFDEAGERFTLLSQKLNDRIDQSADERNAYFANLAEMGFGEEIFNSISKGLSMVFSYSAAASDIFARMFPMPSAKEIVARVRDIGNAFEKMTIQTKRDSKVLNDLGQIAEGIGASLRIMWDGLKQVASAIKVLIPDGILTKLIQFFAGVATIPIRLEEALKGSSHIFDWVVKTGTLAINVLKGLWSVLSDLTNNFALFHAGVDKAKTIFENFLIKLERGKVSSDENTEGLSKMAGAAKVFAGGFSKAHDAGSKFKDILVYLRDAIQPLIDWMSVLTSKFKDFVSTITKEDIKKGALVVALIWLFDMIRDFTARPAKGFIDILKSIKTGIDDFAEQTSGTLGILKEALKTFVMSVKVNSLLKIAAALLGLAFAIKMLADLDTGNMVTSLTVLSVGLGAMVIAMGSITKIKGLDSRGTMKIVGIAAALMLLAKALKIMDGLDPETMSASLHTLVGVLTALTIALSILGNFGGSMETGALKMIGLAGAIVIMAHALEKMQELDADKLGTAMKALAGTVVALGALSIAVGHSGISPSKALAVVLLSTSILVLSTGIKKMSGISWATLAKGLSSLAVALVSIGVFARLVGDTKMMSAAISVGIIAAALTTMAVGLKALGEIDLATLGIGLGAMAGVLVAIGAFSRFSDAKGMIATAVAVVILAKALEDIATVIGKLGKIPFGQLASGLAGFVVPLVALTAAAKLLEGSIGGALALSVMAVAVGAIVGPIEQLSKLSLGEIATAFIALGGGLAILVGAAALLKATGASVQLLALSVSVLALGAAAVLVGAGVLLFVEALSTLALMAGPAIDGVLQAILQFIKGAIGLIPSLVDLGIALVGGIIKGLLQEGPNLLKDGIQLVIDLAEAMAEKVEPMMEAAVDLLVAFAKGLEKELPKLINTGVELIISFINGLADAITANGEAILTAGWNLLTSLLGLIVTALDMIIREITGFDPKLTEKLGLLGKNSTNSYSRNFTPSKDTKTKMDANAKEIENSAPRHKAAGKSTADAVNKGLLSGPDIKATAKAKIVDPIITGVNDGKPRAKAGGKAVGDAAKAGVQSVGGFWAAGNTMGNSVAGGLSDSTYYVTTAASNLGHRAKKALNSSVGIASPSKVFTLSGKQMGQGLAIGMDSQVKNIWAKGKDLGKAAIGSMQSYADQFTDALVEYMDFAPEVKPVLNLDNLKDGTLDLFSKDVSLKVASTGFADSADGMFSRQIGSESKLQNSYIYNVNNERLLEGATFHVREEADIDRIAVALDRRMSETFTRKGVRVVMP